MEEMLIGLLNSPIKENIKNFIGFIKRILSTI
jgi:hypothetical protein